MRQLLRITATFALALVFSTGMAFGQVASNKAEVSQEGENNLADVEQVDFNSPGAKGHRATITQKNGENEATVLSQGGEGRNFVTIEQSAPNSGLDGRGDAGAQNVANVEHLWGGNTSTIVQEGLRNNADITTRGTYDSYMEITQTGDDNFASISDQGQLGQDQVTPFPPNSPSDGQPFINVGTTAEITQTGDRNVATVFQNGDANSAFITQDAQ